MVGLERTRVLIVNTAYGLHIAGASDHGHERSAAVVAASTGQHALAPAAALNSRTRACLSVFGMLKAPASAGPLECPWIGDRCRSMRGDRGSPAQQAITTSMPLQDYRVARQADMRGSIADGELCGNGRQVDV